MTPVATDGKRLFIGGAWDGRVVLVGNVWVVCTPDGELYARRRFVLEGLGAVQVFILDGLTVEPEEVAQRLAETGANGADDP